MKASELICKLAKQIGEHGDWEVNICTTIGEVPIAPFEEVDFSPLSITWDEGNKEVQIYGE